MSTRAIEATYRIRRLPRQLYTETPQWPGISFEQHDEHNATLRLWVDGIPLQDEVPAKVAALKLRAQELILAWELLHMRRLEVDLVALRVPAFDGSDVAGLRDTVALSGTGAAHLAYIPAPPETPRIPIHAERWVKTFAEAGDFPRHVEEQLRRAFLVIEELWCFYKNQYDAEAHKEQREIKCVRDFVSHPDCNNPRVVALITVRLPDAVVEGKLPPTVRFKRNDAHRNFVAGFATRAENLARNLIAKAIANGPFD